MSDTPTYSAWQPVNSAGPAGEPEITRLVHAFYGKIADHPELGPIFTRALEGQWDAHLDKMVDFWCSLMLGEKRYDGRPLPAHLKLPDLQDHHFGQWLALFRQTAAEVLAPDDAAQFIAKAEHVARGFRYAIAVHRGEPLPG